MKTTAGPTIEVIRQCRSCGCSNLIPVLDLGETPLANALLEKRDLDLPEEVYPLKVVFCPECTLVQITVTVSPEKLFREYLYFSSFSDALLRHSRSVVTALTSELGLGPDNLAAEIASNDGYLLQYYREAGIPVLGIEPARNIAKVAEEERGIRTICDFFGLDLARRLRQEGMRADVFHANNVLGHVPDLNGVIEGIHTFLADDGVAVLETPYVKDLIDSCEFDTIYHEHLHYYSLTAMDHLLGRHGLIVERVERVPIHGGTLRLFVRQASRGERGPSVCALLEEERGWGVNDPGFYTAFGQRVDELRSALVTLLGRLRGEGKRIAAYGASAKGSTLLNCFGIGRGTLDYVVDRSPHKQGHFTPGTGLEISSPERLLKDFPDCLLLLTWNFADEILEQQAEYRRRGGQFIIPIPELRVI